MSKITIRLVDNGYILQFEDGVSVYYDEDIVCLLNELVLNLKPSSRHDEKRIYVIEAPGDKHKNWTNTHSKVIYGE